jgi:hypothetical protein
MSYRQIPTPDVPNTAGVVNPGVNSAPAAAPATETLVPFAPPDSVSDWLDWLPQAGVRGPLLNFGILRFGADGVVAPSGALRFATPINSREVLIASRNQLTGDFQSIINVSSGPAGVVQSLEIGREFFEQLLLYGRNLICVCNSGPLGNDGAGWFWEQEGFSYQATMTAVQTTKSIGWVWSMAGCTQAAVTTSIKGGKGCTLLYQAGESVDADGGVWIARGGLNGAGGATLHGGCQWQFHNGIDGDTHLELVELEANRRIVAIAQGADLTTAEMPANTGDKVVFIAESAATPTANPNGGDILFVQGGVMKYRDPAGNEITL